MGIGGSGEGWGIAQEIPKQSTESWLRDRRSEQRRQEKAEPINRIHAVLSQKSANNLLTAEERQILEIVEEARAKMNRQNR